VQTPILRVFVALLLTASSIQHSIAAEGEQSASGTTVTVVIGNAAGGTIDVVGRLLATSMSVHLPGRPRLVFVNQPAAEGVTSLNSFVRDAKPDGLAITVGAPTQSDPSFYRSAHAKYDLQTLAFVGGVQGAGSALLTNRDALNRLTQLDGLL
jgi:tripartite-type tricarboxylate transporter receptor subunit TctC